MKRTECSTDAAARAQLRPGLCYSDERPGLVHHGLPNRMSQCGRPLGILLTGWSVEDAYCPECEAVNGGPVLAREGQGRLL
jgi:hypothetical protein